MFCFDHPSKFRYFIHGKLSENINFQKVGYLLKVFFPMAAMNEPRKLKPSSFFKNERNLGILLRVVNITLSCPFQQMVVKGKKGRNLNGKYWNELLFLDER